jgi:FtsZ-interacting cell division protein ZipA
MEQIVWSIIIIVFIIYTALKNRAKNRPDAYIDKTANVNLKARNERDKLSRYMEELLGIEGAETKPQFETEREIQKSLEQKVTQEEELEAETKVVLPTAPLMDKQKSPTPAEREIYHASFPWETLSRKDIRSAIVLSEIIGPPISKRKSHRLF